MRSLADLDDVIRAVVVGLVSLGILALLLVISLTGRAVPEAIVTGLLMSLSSMTAFYFGQRAASGTRKRP